MFITVGSDQQLRSIGPLVGPVGACTLREKAAQARRTWSPCGSAGGHDGLGRMRTVLGRPVISYFNELFTRPLTFYGPNSSYLRALTFFNALWFALFFLQHCFMIIYAHNDVVFRC